MKQIKSNTKINQLFRPLAETTEQCIRGGAFDEIGTTGTTETAHTPVVGGSGYIKIKKLNSG